MEKIAFSFGKAVIKDSDNIIKNILAILQKNNCFGQLVSAKAIASEKHIQQAIEQTISAFETGTNFANRKEIELLLRLSGRKQVGKAVEALGVKEGKQEVAVIAVGEQAEKAVSETSEMLKLKKEKCKPDSKALRKTFEIGKKQEKIGSLENTVLEKCALLALED